jgi:hypothetical protein
VEPLVRDIRTALFGSAGVPFETWRKAEAWIGAPGPRRQRADLAAIYAAFDRLAEAWEREYPPVSGYALTLRPTYKFLQSSPTLEPEEQAPLVTWPGTPQWELARSSEEIADLTGCSEYEVVRHLLMGTPLRTPRLRVTSERRGFGSPVTRTFMHLTFAGVFPSDIEWRKLRTVLRPAWHAAGDDDDVATLAQVLATKGPEPPAGEGQRRRYWEAVLAAVQGAGVKQWNSWRTVRQFMKRSRRGRRRRRGPRG